MQDPVAFSWNYCPICGVRLELRDDGEKPRPYCVHCYRFYYRNPVPAVCCFIARGDEVLLAQRAVEPCRGEWSLPGGFVELGETTEEALVREMREETGLEVSELRLIGVSTQQSPSHGAITVLGYLVEKWDGEPRPDSDALALAFFPKAQRPPLPFRVHQDLIAIFDRLKGL